MSENSKVLQFHHNFGVPIGSSWRDPARRALRRSLIQEETAEYLEADLADDYEGVAKELADILYVVYGAAIEYGIYLPAIFDEVHRSNMAKLGPDGRPILREDGKILKPPTWTPPDIKRFLPLSGDHHAS